MLHHDITLCDYVSVMTICGDVVAKWIVCGTENLHVTGLSLSAASWLTM